MLFDKTDQIGSNLIKLDQTGSNMVLTNMVLMNQNARSLGLNLNLVSLGVGPGVREIHSPIKCLGVLLILNLKWQFSGGQEREREGCHSH